MSSIIPGYEYDIFISYRQKDNKHDGWVTDFVNNLKGELEATFKENISVYFDINDHDGLLETYDVDASLKDKLKCLIFIPVISRTYCDPKSFAWEHEFKAFVEHASNDQFGLKIKLPGGNVASRVLPVQIHDLDADDKKLIESELGGFLRGIEFIYKEPGVNRPLMANENHPDNNVNKTFYRNQINKVANTIKEIITGLNNFGHAAKEITKQIEEAPPPVRIERKLKIILGSLLFLLVISLGYFLLLKPSKSSGSADISIAVLPFQNLSNDSTQIYICDGFMEELLNDLQRIKEFTVRSRTSTDHYRRTSKTIKTIGEELNVKYVIEGSVEREDNKLKIWVQLINAKTDEHIWANDYTRELKQIFFLQSEIAKVIANELEIVLSPEEKKLIDKKPTENLEAYNFYLKGNEFYWRSNDKQDCDIAAKMYRSAIELDPNFSKAYVRLSICYLFMYWSYFDHSQEILAKSKQAIDRSLQIDPNLPDAHIALGTYYFWGFLNYSKALDEIRIAEQQLSNNSECIFTRANIYRRSGEWSLAEENYLKAYEFDHGSPVITENVGETDYLTGKFQEAEKYFNKSIILNPAFIDAYWLHSKMYLKWKGNTVQARETMAKASQFEESISNMNIFELNVLLDIYDDNYQRALNSLSAKSIDVIDDQFYFHPKSLLYARVYSLMKMPDKAHEYFDSARITIEPSILRDPDDPRLYSAAGIAYAGLGQKEKAISAGEKALEMMPINKEAYRGACRAEDLARIYVMVGKYDEALEQIKILLSIPSELSVKLLLLDPVWKPLWDMAEFKKISGTS
jgi:serine/threonine-protein kinase